jgi:hypothetical protein
LDKNGLSYIFLNHKDSVNIVNNKGIKEIGFNLKNRIKDIFEQNIMYHFHIQTKIKEGKLIFYGQLKDRYIKENYLNLKNVEYRKVLSNIRMSTHKIELETGRYKNIERENRLCKSCNMMKNETEENFLLDCTAYNHHRKVFNTELYSISGIDFVKLRIEAIKKIFLQDNVSIINAFAKFIKECWGTRDSIGQ